MNTRYFIIGLVLLSLFSTVFAETTCEAKDCKITITLKIAFSFQNVPNEDQYIQNAKNEIENVWNGNGQVFGDCKCPVSFKVETKKVADCKNNPPAGYHCISVTDYNNNPPRNQENWAGAKFYIGYMYGIATGNGGNSQKGWWSSIMSRPVDANNPQGEHYQDFAHEAGHMMGLEDGDGGLMDVTSGPNAKPTQAHIDEIVGEICGINACPDRCCCGNGQVDRNKNEQCDPMATPQGCPSDEYCCPGCCQCYGKICFPENGEYLTQSECQSGCGPDASCYYNYQTGCWDCVTYNVVEEIPYSDTLIFEIPFGAHSERNEDADKLRSLYENGIHTVPYFADLFSDEKVNFDVLGKDKYHMVTRGGEIVELEGGFIEDPTVIIFSDSVTLMQLEIGAINPVEAFKQNRINIVGQGFWEGIKFWFAELMVDWFVPVDAVGPYQAEETEEGIIDYPPIRDIVDQNEPVAPTGEEFPEYIPDETLEVDVEYYETIGLGGSVVYEGDID